ncbi:hypothetical protein HN51_005372 [Arachis hypogaea]
MTEEAQSLKCTTSCNLFGNKQEIMKYKLGHPKIFQYLNQSNCYELEGIDEHKEYIAIKRAMDVGMSSEEQDVIFRVVAAILHLGNIEFMKGKEIDSFVPKDEKCHCLCSLVTTSQVVILSFAKVALLIWYIISVVMCTLNF